MPGDYWAEKEGITTVYLPCNKTPYIIVSPNDTQKKPASVLTGVLLGETNKEILYRISELITGDKRSVDESFVDTEVEVENEDIVDTVTIFWF